MKKLNLQLDSIKEMLTKEQMKKIVGGYGGGSGCSTDSNGLCGGNCQRPSGAADKCRTNKSGSCTCGGV